MQSQTDRITAVQKESLVDNFNVAKVGVSFAKIGGQSQGDWHDEKHNGVRSSHQNNSKFVSQLGLRAG